MPNFPELPANLLDSPKRTALYDYWQNDARLQKGELLKTSDVALRLMTRDAFQEYPEDLQLEIIESFDNARNGTTPPDADTALRTLTDLIYSTEKLPETVIEKAMEVNDWWDETLDSQRPALDAWISENMGVIGQSLIDQYVEYGVPREVLERRFFDDNGDVRLDFRFMTNKQYLDTIILGDNDLDIAAQGMPAYANVSSGYVAMPNSEYITEGSWRNNADFVHLVFHEAAHMFQGAVIEDPGGPNQDVQHNLTFGLPGVSAETTTLALEFATDVIASEARNATAMFAQLEGNVISYYTHPDWQEKAAPLLESRDLIPAAIRASVVDFNPTRPDIYRAAHEKLAGVILKSLTR